MKWQDDDDFRIVMDSGSWNFRAATSTFARTYNAVDRVLQDPKTNKLLNIPDTDRFINEVDYKYINSHTKGILTNYMSYNSLCDEMLQSFGIEGEKRNVKQYSCTFLNNVFEPRRALCNRLEYLFEILGFGGVRPAKLGEHIFTSATNYSGVVIDMGHSGCSISPVFAGSLVKNAYRKLDIGGKLISMCLMDNISTTQLNIRGHFYTANDIKEKLCYIYRGTSDRFKHDIKNHRFSEGCYALPDYEIQKKGCLVSSKSVDGPVHGVIRLSSERAVIPEALFNPSMYVNKYGKFAERYY